MNVTLRIGKKILRYEFANSINLRFFVEYIKHVRFPHNIETIDYTGDPDFVVGVFTGVDLEKYKKSVKFIMFGEPSHRGQGSESDRLYNFAFGDRPYPKLCFKCPALHNFSIVTSCEKTRLISALDSSKYEWRMKMIREYIEKNKLDGLIDLYGHGLNSKRVPGGYHNFPNGKQETLDPYKFTIAIENGIENDYFSEKLTDAFITETVPVYGGCINYETYFPAESRINILEEPFDPDSYIRRRTAVEYCKNLTLSRYNLLSYFYIISENMSLLNNQRPISLDTRV